jgi:hypothetical protein
MSHIVNLEVRATTDTGQVISYDRPCAGQSFHEAGMMGTLMGLTDELRCDVREQGLL